MVKHAFLIIAHKNDKTLKTLIKLLDYMDNDIFIHMDAKLQDYDARDIEKFVHKAHIYHTERTNVQWSGYSQINAELLLLEKAINTDKYEYYHLISGEDLPLMNQIEFRKFFKKNNGKEFLDFQNEKFAWQERVRYWYPFADKWGRKRWKITKLMMIAQKPFVHRNKNILFQKGQNWFSITDDFARYVISKKAWIEKVFAKTWCCDEVFLQTLLINSRFKNNVYKDSSRNTNSWMNSCCMRYIDWLRGAPYVFRTEDFDELMKCGMCFARKFDAKVDDKIIEKIEQAIKGRKK
jgi:hypothetical protein